MPHGDNSYAGMQQAWHKPDIYSKPIVTPVAPTPKPFTVTSGGTSMFPQLEPDPCLEKHIVAEVAQYPDGVFGDCVECGERVQIPTVPGGYTAIQIRGFLERVLAGGEDSDGELLAELGSLSAILQMEKDELELALKRLEIAREILLQRSVV